MARAGGTRSQQDREAANVEIVYALLSAAFLGAVVFGAVAGPAAVWDLPGWATRSLVLAGGAVAGVLAVLRVVHVLRQYERHRRG
ncbi:hypothetical protein I5Q34_28385 [Streptomyces sp. AV19]|uniref:DUF6332 family protein n=1 Tax=Streptomyces sp. AV19 TaxID=2793068 RepID=UPI0018FE4545|nr:DUF6332 family protein [Streptomyces sp. AV19]MBH1938134.1 hypothetical protein [Streptomyces sp. AV19]MDG4533931.1 DUF6332 family protein [Streptomyces sp. AV19]